MEKCEEYVPAKHLGQSRGKKGGGKKDGGKKRVKRLGLFFFLAQM